ncbi:unnamed protein product [Strongylus vulgaris]|uniref:Uncharacterized protein n=1 Tax=Strongylus vulgaris TaxID=40348 RepID=A0A3P7LIU2_STRVU|nr:unnamed protein product [Strongylus vulgaris]
MTSVFLTAQKSLALEGRHTVVFMGAAENVNGDQPMTGECARHPWRRPKALHTVLKLAAGCACLRGGSAKLCRNRFVAAFDPSQRPSWRKKSELHKNVPGFEQNSEW